MFQIHAHNDAITGMTTVYVMESEKTDHFVMVRYGPKALPCKVQSRDFAISIPRCSTYSILVSPSRKFQPSLKLLQAVPMLQQR